jgi:Fasciclin domain
MVPLLLFQFFVLVTPSYPPPGVVFSCVSHQHFHNRSYNLLARPTTMTSLQNKKSTLCTLITELGLVDDLSDGVWTVFAPTNQAFIDTVIDPTYDVSDLILFHTVVGVRITSVDLTCQSPGQLTEMANGFDTRTICGDGDTIKYQKGEGT